MSSDLEEDLYDSTKILPLRFPLILNKMQCNTVSVVMQEGYSWLEILELVMGARWFWGS
jgi:hypothetical protein